jgi:hypothetical protein
MVYDTKDKGLDICDGGNDVPRLKKGQEENSPAAGRAPHISSSEHMSLDC